MTNLIENPPSNQTATEVEVLNLSRETRENTYKDIAAVVTKSACDFLCETQRKFSKWKSNFPWNQVHFIALPGLVLAIKAFLRKSAILSTLFWE